MTGIRFAFLLRIMRHSSLGLVFCLAFVLLIGTLGCQIRESEFITDPVKRPFDWTAKIASWTGDYDAIFDWSPNVPATIVRQKRDAVTREWKVVDRLEVKEKTEDSIFWHKQEQGAQYRFAIEVNDPTLDLSAAPNFLYLRVPRDGALPQKDHVITPGKLSNVGVAHIRVNRRDPLPVIFTGGVFEIHCTYLSAYFGKSTIYLTNSGAAKNEKFDFTIKAEAGFDVAEIVLGPFDPAGPAPHIDIQVSSMPILMNANGKQHPKQRVRLVSDETITFFVGDKRLKIGQYEGIYRPTKKEKAGADNGITEKFVMITLKGKIYRFGQYHDGEWAVLDDADFYPVDFEVEQYEKLDWKDDAIPQAIKNVKELIDAIGLINGSSYRPLQFNLTSIYQVLPDRKLIEVVKELKKREREFNVAKLFANVSEIYLSNMISNGPEYAFMRQEILHSLGVGMEGTPTEIVDQLFANFKEARLHVPER